MKPAMNAAYIRVSTTQQDYDAQRAAIEQAVAARGVTIGEWFCEKTGGHRMKRPELDRLRQAVRAGKVRRVFVFRIDRLSRGGIADTFHVVDELRNCGCVVESVADPFAAALSGPLADLCLAMLAWAAQMERSALNERLQAARARAKSRGLGWGRPKVLSDDTVRLALDAIRSGQSMRHAARELGIPKTTLARTLAQNPDALRAALSHAKMPKPPP